MKRFPVDFVSTVDQTNSRSRSRCRGDGLISAEGQLEKDDLINGLWTPAVVLCESIRCSEAEDEGNEETLK